MRRGTRSASPPATSTLGFAGDLSRRRGGRRAGREHPGIQVLVNNLGIFEAKAFEEIPDADWVRFFEMNVLSGARTGAIGAAGHASRQLGPHRRHLERKRHAHPGGGWFHYGMTKAAQIAVARGIAETVAGHRHHGEQRAARADAFARRG
jgi:NAD(P)-dependent dehydrogenase (short-subunit alcohol dehydrogenase family)